MKYVQSLKNEQALAAKKGPQPSGYYSSVITQSGLKQMNSYISSANATK